MRPFASLLLIATVAAASATVHAAPEPAAEVDAATLAQLRDAAMQSDYAFERLSDLTDRIGPRLSGSKQAAAAVTQVAEAMRALGATVTLQPVKVPHWVRGEERAELVGYPGQPEGLTQRIDLTALGGSSATPAKGLTREVIVVRSFAELEAKAAAIKDRIVLLSVPFDQNLADTGHSGVAYGQGGEPRFRGPAVAAKLGAAAMLVRSVGGARYRLPHTGATRFDEKGPKIPAAAVTVEDALLIERLAAKGPVTMKLTVTPQTLPDADSYNVIADWPGREKPEEVVVISGHLDSWDLGTGAIDDGAGVASAMGALSVLKSLGLKARRTIRLVAYMNEENGSRGARAYFDANKASIGRQIAAIESDAGAGLPLGIDANVTLPSMKRLEALVEALRPIGASVLKRSDRPVGADIAPLSLAGVPGFEPMVDTRHYFDYHHTAADTLDKVDPDNLRRQVAVMTTLVYWLADAPEPLERLPVDKAD